MTQLNLFSRSRRLARALPFALALSSLVPSLAGAYSCPDGNNHDLRCGVISRNGTALAYPKMQWTRLDSTAGRADPTPSFSGYVNLSDRGAVAQSDWAFLLADESARAADLASNEVATAIKLTSTNVPLVLGRYDPMTKTLRVEVFKVERDHTGANGVRGALYHGEFTPDQGRFWRANRSYLAPSVAAAGTTAGLDPFEAFHGSDDAVFYNITLNAAQVVVGHAMRMVGTQTGVLAAPVVTPVPKTTTRKSGIKKRVTTRVFANVTTTWYLAQPLHLVRRDEQESGVTAYCASNVSATSCPTYETAMSGVTFRQSQGGSFAYPVYEQEVASRTKSGFRNGFINFLNAPMLPVVDPVLTALNSATIPDSLVPNEVLGVYQPTAYQTNPQQVTLDSLVSVIEGSGTMLGGSQPMVTVESGKTSLDEAVVTASAVPAATAEPDDDLARDVETGTRALLGTYFRTDTTTGDTPGVAQQFVRPMFGGCRPGRTEASCAAEGVDRGVVQRADSFQTRDYGEYLRDSSGTPLRTDN